MKLLIVTQVVDTEDPVLGFFVRWIEELAKQYENVEVICLKKGKYSCPANVRVHSLGKEQGVSRLRYVLNLYRLIWQLRNDYDAALVHMNQEYIVLAGWLWKILGKRMYLWRNHYAGSWLTTLAVWQCRAVFYTSKHSYTARYRCAQRMPVGVDADRFSPDSRVVPTPHSILSLGRIAPSKLSEVLIDALALLANDGREYRANIYGSPLPKDEAYRHVLKEKIHTLGLADRVVFHPGIPNSQTPEVYRAHTIFVNTSPSGMLDKTLFEAAACGTLPLAASADWKELAGEDFSFDDAANLAQRLTALLALSPAEISGRADELRARVVEANSLKRLGSALSRAMG